MHVAAVPHAELGLQGAGESSAVVRARVEAARVRQRLRFRESTSNGGEISHCNGQAPARWLGAHAHIDTNARDYLRDAAGRLQLSARGFHRVLRIARTVADLDDQPNVAVAHVGEALRYRPAAVETL